MNTKKAFTLAEVLITLSIIGIIAAFTMPILIGKYNKYIIETRLKQNYSLFQNAMMLAQAEYGDIKTWEGNNTQAYDDIGKKNTEDFVSKYLIKYLKVVKGGRMTISELGYKTNIYKTDGQTVSKSLDSTDAQLRYVLSNGSIILLLPRYYKNSLFLALAIEVDMNGIKGPNTLGKDIFRYYMTLDGKHNFNLINYNWSFNFDSMEFSYTTLNHDELVEKCSDISQNATYCGALIMENGWKIPKDYPFKI